MKLARISAVAVMGVSWLAWSARGEDPATRAAASGHAGTAAERWAAQKTYKQEQEFEVTSKEGVTVELLSFLVRYTRDKEGKYQVGYLDVGSKALYLWKGVVLKEDDIPVEVSPYHRVAEVMDLAKDTGWAVAEIDPPVQFVRLEGGKLAPGYLDFENRRFLRWKGIEMAAESLQADEKMKHQVISQISQYHVMEIALPEHRKEEAKKLTGR